MNKVLFSFLIVLAIDTPALAVGTPAKGKPAINNLPVSAQRLISSLSPKEFSALTGQQMGLFDRLGYNKLRKSCARALAARGLQNNYDTLYLADGGVEVGFLLGQSDGQFLYKKQGQQGLQTVAEHRVGRWGLSQTPLADSTNTAKLPFEKDATKAMWMGLGAIGSLLIPLAASVYGLIILGLLGIIFGIRALKKIKKSDGKLRGTARAWVGIGIGVIVMALLLILIGNIYSL